MDTPVTSYKFMLILQFSLQSIFTLCFLLVSCLVTFGTLKITRSISPSSSTVVSLFTSQCPMDKRASLVLFTHELNLRHQPGHHVNDARLTSFNRPPTARFTIWFISIPSVPNAASPRGQEKKGNIQDKTIMPWQVYPWIKQKERMGLNQSPASFNLYKATKLVKTGREYSQYFWWYNRVDYTQYSKTFSFDFVSQVKLCQVYKEQQKAILIANMKNSI